MMFRAESRTQTSDNARKTKKGRVSPASFCRSVEFPFGPGGQFMKISSRL